MIRVPSLLLFFLLLSASTVFAATNPVINEFVPHPSSGNTEWIEIYNPDHLDVTQDFIDDDTDFNSDTGSSAKKQLSSIIISGDYATIDISSFLNNDGDWIVLFASDGAMLDSYHFDKDPGIDVSIGRNPDGTGSFGILATTTKGNQNSGFFPTPTPTPAPTPTPTRAPTPTHTPTPTPSPKPTHTPTPVPLTTIYSMPTQAVLVAKTTVAKEASDSAEATTEAVLAGAIASSSPTSDSVPTQKLSPRKKSSFAFPTVLFIASGVCLIGGCGILVYQKWQKKTTMES